jgi:hypothetical protein
MSVDVGTKLMPFSSAQPPGGPCLNGRVLAPQDPTIAGAVVRSFEAATWHLRLKWPVGCFLTPTP